MDIRPPGCNIKMGGSRERDFVTYMLQLTYSLSGPNQTRDSISKLRLLIVWLNHSLNKSHIKLILARKKWRSQATTFLSKGGF